MTTAAPIPQVLARVYASCFPTGEAAAHRIRTVHTTQRGEMRSSPHARWIPFTAEEVAATTHSSFCWTARMDSGKINSATVIDAFDRGHGRLIVKAAGVVPVKRMSGPELDQGELQRYLASVSLCPAMLLNHASLECVPNDDSSFQLRDREDTTGAVVQVSINHTGEMTEIRAERLRIAGKNFILTAWSASCSDFSEWEGMRVPSRIQVTWHLPEGPFTYFRGEITHRVALH
jgi:hypothetical protein